MSLTAHLLFNAPTTLPAGRQRFHSLDTGKSVPRDKPHNPGAEKQKLVAADNIERIYQAIAAGHATMEAAAKASGVSLSTVKKALPILEAASPPRIVRQRGQRTHKFRVVK